MPVGVAALFNFVGAVLSFVSNIFTTVAEAAFLSGDPEVSTPVLLIVVWCLGSGHYVKAVALLFVTVCADLVAKELGFSLSFE